MLSITQYAPGAVEMTLRGLVDTNDVEMLEQALTPYLPDEGSISAVIDMTEATDSSGKTLTKDTNVAARLMGQLDKFGRIAVVSPTSQLAGMVKAVDGLMPVGAMAQFDPDQKEAARKFAAHLN